MKASGTLGDRADENTFLILAPDTSSPEACTACTIALPALLAMIERCSLLNFTFSSLEANRAALRRLDEFYLSLKECAADESVNDELPDWAFEGRNQFVQEMDDDMNISGALAALFHIVHTGNIELKNNNISSSQALALLQLWSELDTVLGLLIPKKEEIPIDIIALADLRIIARNEKNWAESDRLRDEILSQGWFIKDAAEGYKLRKIK